MIKKLIINDFIRANISKYSLGLFALILSCILQLAAPKLLGYIIDCLKLHAKSPADIFHLTLGLLGLSITGFALKFLWRYLLVGRARDLECFLRSKLFAHLQTLPLSFYHQQKTGDLMAYAINDLNAIRRAFAFGLVFLIDGIIINLASILVMVKTIHPGLTLSALSPLLLAVIIIFKIGAPLRAKFTVVQKSFAKISEKIQENISGIRVIKSYLQEESEIKAIEIASKARIASQMEYIKLSAILAPAVQICFGISFTLVLVSGSRYVSQGVITLDDFIAFNTYLAMLTRPVTHIGKIVEVWQCALASMHRLDVIFQTKTDIADPKNLSANHIQGNLELKNLTFCYPGRNHPALKDINLCLPAGKTLAIIGKTGSGKSTLIQLLLRLFPVEPGQILIDGMDINEISLADLRQNIGYVPQENFLFSASIKHNIAFFTQSSQTEIEDVARISSVYENITGFPNGFETLVGERGITLSGGQKQRIAIARAVIKEPAILIFDDCFSAVDTRTEESILTNLKSTRIGRTAIFASHRISTIQHCDEIIVLDDGTITERGNHSQLMALKGYYYQQYCTQLVQDLKQGEA